MGVAIDFTRKAVQVTWDKDKIKSHKVKITASHGGDLSTREDLVNDGAAVLTFPAGYHGEAKVVVCGPNEHVGHDEGFITV